MVFDNRNKSANESETCFLPSDEVACVVLAGVAEMEACYVVEVTVDESDDRKKYVPVEALDDH